MNNDKKLMDVIFITKPVLDKLRDLEIHSLRQLYARLRASEPELENYLDLSDAEFSHLRARIEQLMEEEFPQDTLSQIHPRVHKRGVAAHRIYDPSRPEYYKDNKS